MPRLTHMSNLLTHVPRTPGRRRNQPNPTQTIQVRMSLTPRMVEEYDSLGGATWVREQLMNSIIGDMHPDNQVAAWLRKARYWAWISCGADHSGAEQFSDRDPAHTDMEPFLRRYCPEPLKPRLEQLLAERRPAVGVTLPGDGEPSAFGADDTEDPGI